MDEIQSLHKRITDALNSKGAFEVISASGDDKKLRLAGRVPTVGDGQWGLMRSKLLRRAKVAKWSVDISKHYFVQEVNGVDKDFYCWRVIFTAPSLKEQLRDILTVISSVPRVRKEVMEVPLGTVAHRKSRNGGGAYSISGEAGVPAILNLAAARMRGGSY